MLEAFFSHLYLRENKFQQKIKNSIINSTTKRRYFVSKMAASMREKVHELIAKKDDIEKEIKYLQQQLETVSKLNVTGRVNK